MNKLGPTGLISIKQFLSWKLMEFPGDSDERFYATAHLANGLK